MCHLLTFSQSCSNSLNWKHWSSFTFLWCHDCNNCCWVLWTESKLCKTIFLISSKSGPRATGLLPPSPPLSLPCPVSGLPQMSCNSRWPITSISSTGAFMIFFFKSLCRSILCLAPLTSSAKSLRDRSSWRSSSRSRRSEACQLNSSTANLCQFQLTECW